MDVRFCDAKIFFQKIMEKYGIGEKDIKYLISPCMHYKIVLRVALFLFAVCRLQNVTIA